MSSHDLLPPQAHYEVELLYGEVPEFDVSSIAQSLAASFEDLVVTLVDDGAGVAISEGDSTAHWIIRPGESVDEDLLHASICQTWHWGEGRARAMHARTSLRIIDHASRLDYKTRLSRMRAIAGTVTRQTNPRAIHWVESQQIGDPAELLRALEEQWIDPILFAVNVRLFRIDPEPDDSFASTSFVMDTLGLAPFGLPDVQCHFRHLDPTRVGPVLYDVAQTLFERGPVVHTGSKVSGLEGDTWLVQFEDSIADPPRGVLDLNPGKPYAAGERNMGQAASD